LLLFTVHSLGPRLMSLHMLDGARTAEINRLDNIGREENVENPIQANA
jgi:hypothetical protein